MHCSEAVLELYLEKLEERRTRRKLQLLYNIQNGSTPSYLLDLIPPTIQSTTMYPLRNGNDIIVLEGSQLRLLNSVSLLSIFITIKKEMVRICTWCATVTGST
jgi:hypothetical protein